jgi:hypothetical protein
VAQTLLYWLGARLDPQGMLDNFPQNTQRIRGFPREDVAVRVEEVDERAFLLGGEGPTDVQHFAIGADGVNNDLLGVLHRLKGAR